MSNLIDQLIKSFETTSLTITLAELILAIIIVLSLTYLKQSIRAVWTYSKKHEYDQKMLKLEEQKEMRQKSENVAELMAEWLKPEENIDFHRLNSLSMQAFLWLPVGLAEEMGKVLIHKSEKKDAVRRLLKDIRTHLQEQEQEDALLHTHLVIWDKTIARRYKAELKKAGDV